MRTLLKFIFLFFVFSVLFILPNVFMPLDVEMEEQSEYNALMLLLLLLTDLSIIVYLIKRLDLWGAKLFVSVVVIFWGLQTFLPQLETWYFREAMPAITNDGLRDLFGRPLITSITFVPLAMWVLGKWQQETNRSGSHTPGHLNWKEVSGLAVAYVALYFIFGYFIAWQFEAVRVFYSGSAEDAGFIGQMRQTLNTETFIVPFQFLRGILWIAAGLPIVLYLRGGKTEKIIACMILYSFPAIQLLVDNPFMPAAVRTAHFVEVATSNGIFGLLIGYAAKNSIRPDDP